MSRDTAIILMALLACCVIQGIWLLTLLNKIDLALTMLLKIQANELERMQAFERRAKKAADLLSAPKP